MSKNIDIQEPDFDATYFEKLNDGAKESEDPQEVIAESSVKGGKIMCNVEPVELEEFDFDLEQYEDPNTNFAKIMEFYYRLLNSKEIPDELKKQMIFYGGTVAYAMLEKKPKQYKTSRYRGWDTNRYFKDVDIFVPLKALKEVRNILFSLKDFKMRSDSTDLFVANKDSEESKATAEQVYNKIYHKDFGFNSNLFGMNISVHPIFEESGCINSRGFRLGDKCGMPMSMFSNYSNDENDARSISDWMRIQQESEYKWDKVIKYPDYLLETALARDYSLDDFVTQARILGKDVNIATLEFTLASKLLARQRGYTSRTIRDHLDIDFINENADSLGINLEKLELLKQKVACDILCAYDIRNGQVEQEIGENEYRHRLRLEHTKSIEPWT